MGPRWKNEQKIAFTARRPSAISAPSFAGLADGPEEVSTLESKSPLDAAVPED
jgi:hypothetical protein